MPLDFPTSPTNGQSYTGANGALWIWDGTKWISGSDPSGTVPEAPSDGKAYGRKDTLWTSVPFYVGSDVNITGKLTSNDGLIVNGNQVDIKGSFPRWRMTANGAAVDNKIVDGYVSTTGMFALQLVNDAVNNGLAFLTMERTGMTPTLLTLTANAIRFVGNVGIGVVPPTGQAVPSVEGGWSFQWGITAANRASNAYYDGTNWRYLENGYAAMNNSTANAYRWYTASSGTKGAIITLAPRMVLNDILLDTYGRIQSGSHIIATSAARGPFIGSWQTTTAPATNVGFWNQNDHFYIGNADGSGTTTSYRAYFSPDGSLFANAGLNGTGVYVSQGLFQIGPGFFMQRNPSDGAWRFVENSVTNFTISTNGDCTARSSISGVNVLGSNGVWHVWAAFGMTTVGAYRTLQFGGSEWQWTWNSANGDMSWSGSGGVGLWNMRRSPDNLTWNPTGTVGGVGAYWNLSDGRIKCDIEDTNYGLAEILRLRPVSFTRIAKEGAWETPRPTEIGFVAQDIRDVLPEAVVVMGAPLPDGTGGLDDDNPTLGMTLDPIVATMVNAIKELSARLETLEGRSQ